MRLDKNVKMASLLGLGTVLVAGTIFSFIPAAMIPRAFAQENAAANDTVNATATSTATVSSNNANSGQDDNIEHILGAKRLRFGGAISSIQSGDNNTTWVVAGTWHIRTEPARANSTNQTATPEIDFRAHFGMVMTDGMAMHMHTIKDFKITEFARDAANNVITMKGTATVTLKDGPKSDVPVTIKIMNRNVVAIQFDTRAVSHFGNTPIYGVVSRV